MSIMASQITSASIVYSTVCSGANQRKHQSSTSLSFVRGIHQWPVNSSYKGPITRKMFPFDDVIMERYHIFHPQTLIMEVVATTTYKLFTMHWTIWRNICRRYFSTNLFLIRWLIFYLPKFTILASMFVCRFVTCQNFQFLQVCSFVGLSVCLSVLSSITHERFDISSPNLVHIWNGWAVPVCDIDR